MTYYKAVRPNGCSFYDSMFRWLPDGWQSGDPVPADLVVEHPDYSPDCHPSGSHRNVES